LWQLANRHYVAFRSGPDDRTLANTFQATAAGRGQALRADGSFGNVHAPRAQRPNLQKSLRTKLLMPTARAAGRCDVGFVAIADGRRDEAERIALLAIATALGPHNDESPPRVKTRWTFGKPSG